MPKVHCQKMLVDSLTANEVGDHLAEFHEDELGVMAPGTALQQTARQQIVAAVKSVEERGKARTIIFDGTTCNPTESLRRELRELVADKNSGMISKMARWIARRARWNRPAR